MKEIRGPLLGVLLATSTATGLGCSGPLPTQGVTIAPAPPEHTRYVTPYLAVPYADQWDSRVQILVAWNETHECPDHTTQTVRITSLYDCTVDVLGVVRGPVILFSGSDRSKGRGGAFTGTLDASGLNGLATTDCDGACGSLRLSSTLALVPEPAP